MAFGAKARCWGLKWVSVEELAMFSEVFLPAQGLERRPPRRI